MKFLDYIKDKIITLLLFLFTYILILFLLFAFKCSLELIISISITLFIFITLCILYDYYRKVKFYKYLINNIEMLDKSYLVLETLQEPHFYEGKILFHALYLINKSMIENLKKYEFQLNDFKDYIEMWIHEVKLPLSALTLLHHNHQELFNTKEKKYIQRINDYVEQVLYYVRSENAEKDYLISKINISKVIKNIALKNKDILLESHVDFLVENVDIDVFTDSKWLEFIINQIINNSIKYSKDNDAYIKLYTYKNDHNYTLVIEDNGIGIPSNDLPRIFDKSFTGYNGRIQKNSTGMGLFICKNLCTKLKHQISIESIQQEYTRVSITFSINDYYDVVK